MAAAKEPHIIAIAGIAKGKPKVSVIIQIIQIIAIVPVVYYGAKKGFGYLSYARALVRVVGMIAYCFAVRIVAGISTRKVISELIPSIVATAVMGMFGFWFFSFLTVTNMTIFFT